MALLSELISADNPVFRSYAFWSCVLIIKMLATSLLTAFARFRTLTFANPEDLILNPILTKKLSVKFGEDKVERVRRAHRNDLENVLPLIFIGFLYILTDPSAWVAVPLFWLAGVGRLIHTFVYAVMVLPRPTRGLVFFVPYFATVHMALATIVHFS